MVNVSIGHRHKGQFSKAEEAVKLELDSDKVLIERVKAQLLDNDRI